MAVSTQYLGRFLSRVVPFLIMGWAVTRVVAAPTPLPEPALPEPISDTESEIPPEGDPAYLAPSPERDQDPAGARQYPAQAPSFGESARAGSTPTFSDTPDSSDEMLPSPPERAPSFGEGMELDSGPATQPSPSLAAPPERAPSFGEGMELDSGPATQPSPALAAPPERAPSFGEGMELSRESPGLEPPLSAVPCPPVPSFGEGAELNRAPVDGELPALTAPPAPARTPSTPDGPSWSRGTSPPPPRVLSVPPVPPPVRSDVLTRVLYQLQAEVYGIEVMLSGRHLLKRLIVRIDLARSLGVEVLNQSRGSPGLFALAREVNDELKALRLFALAMNRPEMLRTVATIEDLLHRMRSLSPA